MFERQDSVRLHLSTLGKGDVLRNLAVLAHEGALKTQASRLEQYGSSAQGFGELVSDHWFDKLAGTGEIIIAIVEVIAFRHHP